MRRTRRRRLAFATLVVALGVLVLWQWRHDRAAAPGPLLSLDPADVTRVALMRPGQATLHYRKRDGHWYRQESSPTRADDDRLAELVAVAATPVLQWRPAGDFEPARIGLQPPSLTLELDGQRIDYGALAAFGPQRYVRVGQRIALIAARDSPRPPPPASSATSKLP